jgi:polysaccharide pyruvyl transferase WcaK-like protein
MLEACAQLAISARKAGLRPIFLFGANANLAADDRDFARLLTRATGGAIELCHATSEAEWLSAIASAKLLVSGRFHYSIAAACLGTPFIALDSNTPKMDGLMQMLGLYRRPTGGIDACGGAGTVAIEGATIRHLPAPKDLP